MIAYGIANQNIRKLLSRDDSAVTRDKDADVLLAKNQTILKLKLGKILEGHGPYAPYGMGDIQYSITLPKAGDIMVAQTGESVDGYKLTGLNLEFETVEGEELATSVRDEYIAGRELWYSYTTLLKTLSWSK